MTLSNNAEQEPHILNAHAGYYRGLLHAKNIYEEFIKQEEAKLG